MIGALVSRGKIFSSIRLMQDSAGYARAPAHPGVIASIPGSPEDPGTMALHEIVCPAAARSTKDSRLLVARSSPASLSPRQPGSLSSQIPTLHGERHPLLMTLHESDTAEFKESFDRDAVVTTGAFANTRGSQGFGHIP
jgi:hypothetical protein